MNANPYEPPPSHSCNPTAAPRRRLGRRIVFWAGSAVIVAALVMYNAGHTLFVHSRSLDGQYYQIVSLPEVLATLGLLVGCTAIVVAVCLGVR